jgi:hypothetical protein
MTTEIIKRREQQLLCDKKWHMLNRRTWLFRHLPFIEFVFGSGSLAVGNVDEESDFDVLIGTRSGRIFTARFFAALAFGLFGWRRAKEHGHADAANKMCLNHFVTPATYRLTLESNAYWKLLYEKLVPVYGSERKIQQFFTENKALIGERKVELDQRYKWREPSDFKNVIEILLRGKVGDRFEEFLKKYQVARIEAGLPSEGESREPHQMIIHGASGEKVELQPLIVYTDDELEFHPDPAVIEFR